jgi:excisionase family DNA binding protein
MRMSRGVGSERGPYTTRAAAERLDVTAATVRRWIARGLLPAIKVGGEWSVEHSALVRFAVDRGR